MNGSHNHLPRSTSLPNRLNDIALSNPNPLKKVHFGQMNGPHNHLPRSTSLPNRLNDIALLKLKSDFKHYLNNNNLHPIKYFCENPKHFEFEDTLRYTLIFSIWHISESSIFNNCYEEQNLLEIFPVILNCLKEFIKCHKTKALDDDTIYTKHIDHYLNNTEEIFSLFPPLQNISVVMQKKLFCNFFSKFEKDEINKGISYYPKIQRLLLDSSKEFKLNILYLIEYSKYIHGVLEGDITEKKHSEIEAQPIHDPINTLDNYVVSFERKLEFQLSNMLPIIFFYKDPNGFDFKDTLKYTLLLATWHISKSFYSDCHKEHNQRSLFTVILKCLKNNIIQKKDDDVTSSSRYLSALNLIQGYLKDPDSIHEVISLFNNDQSRDKRPESFSKFFIDFNRTCQHTINFSTWLDFLSESTTTFDLNSLYLIQCLNYVKYFSIKFEKKFKQEHDLKSLESKIDNLKVEFHDIIRQHDPKNTTPDTMLPINFFIQNFFKQETMTIDDLKKDNIFNHSIQLTILLSTWKIAKSRHKTCFQSKFQNILFPIIIDSIKDYLNINHPDKNLTELLTRLDQFKQDTYLQEISEENPKECKEYNVLSVFNDMEKMEEMTQQKFEDFFSEFIALEEENQKSGFLEFAIELNVPHKFLQDFSKKSSVPPHSLPQHLDYMQRHSISDINNPIAIIKNKLKKIIIFKFLMAYPKTYMLNNHLKLYLLISTWILHNNDPNSDLKIFNEENQKDHIFIPAFKALSEKISAIIKKKELEKADFLQQIKKEELQILKNINNDIQTFLLNPDTIIQIFGINSPAQRFQKFCEPLDQFIRESDSNHSEFFKASIELSYRSIKELDVDYRYVQDIFNFINSSYPTPPYKLTESNRCFLEKKFNLICEQNHTPFHKISHNPNSSTTLEISIRRQFLQLLLLSASIALLATSLRVSSPNIAISFILYLLFVADVTIPSLFPQSSKHEKTMSDTKQPTFLMPHLGPEHSSGNQEKQLLMIAFRELYNNKDPDQWSKTIEAAYDYHKAANQFSVSSHLVFTMAAKLLVIPSLGLPITSPPPDLEEDCNIARFWRLSKLVDRIFPKQILQDISGYDQQTDYQYNLLRYAFNILLFLFHQNKDIRPDSPISGQIYHYKIFEKLDYFDSIDPDDINKLKLAFKIIVNSVEKSIATKTPEPIDMTLVFREVLEKLHQLPANLHHFFNRESTIFLTSMCSLHTVANALTNLLPEKTFPHGKIFKNFVMSNVAHRFTDKPILIPHLWLFNMLPKCLQSDTLKRSISPPPSLTYIRLLPMNTAFQADDPERKCPFAFRGIGILQEIIKHTQDKFEVSKNPEFLHYAKSLIKKVTSNPFSTYDYFITKKHNQKTVGSVEHASRGSLSSSPILGNIINTIDLAPIPSYLKKKIVEKYNQPIFFTLLDLLSKTPIFSSLFIPPQSCSNTNSADKPDEESHHSKSPRIQRPINFLLSYFKIYDFLLYDKHMRYKNDVLISKYNKYNKALNKHHKNIHQKIEFTYNMKYILNDLKNRVLHITHKAIPQYQTSQESDNKVIQESCCSLTKLLQETKENILELYFEDTGKQISKYCTLHNYTTQKKCIKIVKKILDSTDEFDKHYLVKFETLDKRLDELIAERLQMNIKQYKKKTF
ncbi:hypothetical protein DID74_01005 [Candidatus Marinamargulisbacteria bacterium SCGC AG-333-B06]|nr:hypothetical protein DID74_01005 [Candidatus Marinamargulisbacteria bacterium SCGC AG-333-B06]